MIEAVAEWYSVEADELLTTHRRRGTRLHHARCVAILVLHDHGGLCWRDVARTLHCSPSTLYEWKRSVVYEDIEDARKIGESLTRGEVA